MDTEALNKKFRQLKIRIPKLPINSKYIYIYIKPKDKADKIIRFGDEINDATHNFRINIHTYECRDGKPILIMLVRVPDASQGGKPVILPNLRTQIKNRFKKYFGHIPTPAELRMWGLMDENEIIPFEKYIKGEIRGDKTDEYIEEIFNWRVANRMKDWEGDLNDETE